MSWRCRCKDCSFWTGSFALYTPTWIDRRIPKRSVFFSPTWEIRASVLRARALQQNPRTTWIAEREGQVMTSRWIFLSCSMSHVAPILGVLWFWNTAASVWQWDSEMLLSLKIQHVHDIPWRVGVPSLSRIGSIVLRLQGTWRFASVTFWDFTLSSDWALNIEEIQWQRFLGCQVLVRNKSRSCQGYEVAGETKDHTPNAPEEEKRIKAAGGKVRSLKREYLVSWCFLFFFGWVLPNFFAKVEVFPGSRVPVLRVDGGNLR